MSIRKQEEFAFTNQPRITIPKRNNPESCSKNPAAPTEKKADEANYKLMYETLKKESDEKDAVIKKLESQNKLLISTLEQIKEMIAATLKE